MKFHYVNATVALIPTLNTYVFLKKILWFTVVIKPQFLTYHK